MFNNLSTTHLVVSLLLYSFLITSILFVVLVSVKNSMKEQSRILFMLWKQHKKIDVVMDDVKQLSDSVSSLISSIDLNNNRKIYPTPNLAEMIATTIKEQIATEVILTKNLKSFPKESIQKVVGVTTKTYPHVHEEYIIKRTLAIVENTIKNQDDQ